MTADAGSREASGFAPPDSPRRTAGAFGGPAIVLGAALAITLCVQIALAAHNVRRTAELRGTLSQSHSLAIALERRLGYGGLIHGFKNYVLRPDDDGYRRAALDDARQALALVGRLEGNASALGLRADLDDTREMISSYAERLEQVRELSANGRDPRFVDERVRFDDAPALLEVERLIGSLDAHVDARLGALGRENVVAGALGTAGTAALGALGIVIVSRRRRRHAAALDALNAELSHGNAALTRANVSLAQFAGIVSHDLRTPLRHVEMASAMLADDPGDPAAVIECADIVNRSALRMDSIVNGLLDFTRTGCSAPRFERIDPLRLLEGCVAGLDAPDGAEGPRIELDVALAPGTELDVDPALLSRAFALLVGNSLKYAREGVPPRIAIRLAPGHPDAPDGPGAVVCTVTDNGIGIDPRFADRIFEPLERLHGPDGPYEGIGMGLSLARAIAEGHGGRIDLDTGFVGGGTRMNLVLPSRRVIPPVPLSAAA